MYLITGNIEDSYHFLTGHIDLCRHDPVYLCLMIMEKLILDGTVSMQDADPFQDYLKNVFEKNIQDIAFEILFHQKALFEVECDIEKNFFYQNRRSLYIKLYGYQ
jgi:hypothetical protein